MLMDVHQRGDLRLPQSLPEFQRLFPDDAACAAYLEKTRWSGGFICPHCQVVGEPFPSIHCEARYVFRALFRTAERPPLPFLACHTARTVPAQKAQDFDSASDSKARSIG